LENNTPVFNRNPQIGRKVVVIIKFSIFTLLFPFS
jgi:hypothetical protein